jgi:hypothetical protein
VRRLILAALLLVLAQQPAFAELRIQASAGGEVTRYIELFSAIRASGERVVIDGPCVSACTLVLSIVPRERICVTPRAVLGFHAARWMDQQGRFYPAPEPTRVVTAAYPAPVRDWIRRRGGLKTKVILLQGRELDAMYPRCS